MPQPCKPFKLTTSLIDMAYKKLKASMYYDKTQAILRDMIVQFETDLNFHNELDELKRYLLEGGFMWESLEAKILDSIGYLTFPKAVKDKKSTDTLIVNADGDLPKISKYQYFIEISVLGNILGALWILTVGKMIDADVYEHAYGNRLHHNLYTEESCITFSPNLFQPYIQQYGTWRDHALKLTESFLDQQDAFILTLDFKGFFYSISLDEDKYNALFETYCQKLTENGEFTTKDREWIERVHAFVWKVIDRYHRCFANKKVLISIEENEKTKKDEKHYVDANLCFLPIGFLPSNVLSNWVLQEFDKAVIERWNPAYYGRYVDDIIIVEKIERNSDIYQKIHGESEGKLFTAETLIDKYLCNCRNISGNQSACRNAIMSRKPNKLYTIDGELLGHPKSEVCVQPEKLKVFYFKRGASRALLDRFQKDIACNASEFRTLPELDESLRLGDYSGIYEIQRTDTPNKLRGVTGTTLERYAFSKFLGKYSIIRSMVPKQDVTKFEKDLGLIFDEEAILGNYTLWERVFEILVTGNRWNEFADMVKRITVTLQRLSADQMDCSQTLKRCLHAAVNRSASLCWNNQLFKAFERRKVVKYLDSDMRNGYLTTRMMKASAMPAMIELVLKEKAQFSDDNTIDLTKLETYFQPHGFDIAQPLLDEHSIYYPYWIKPQDISFALLCQTIAQNEPLIAECEIHHKTQEIYWLKNYWYVKPRETEHEESVVEIENLRSSPDDTKSYPVIHIKGEPKGNLHIAIANACIQVESFEQTLRKGPTLAYERYINFCKIIDDAIREKCDLLVLPELYLPVSWLPAVTRKCADVQMAMVVGLDFIIGHKKVNDSESVGGNNFPNVYNLTAVILPYIEHDQKHAHVSYHHKVHYSPAEKELIRKYGYNVRQGKDYQLFSWHDIWFPVYCCFELASIQDRAIFNTLADMIVAVEWNRDTPYYEHIGMSLSRDLHCFVVEANTSQYGGSGVIQPTSSNNCELIRTKGGINSAILTTYIPIKALRDAQYPIEGDRKPFKPFPPVTNRQWVAARCSGGLWNMIQSCKMNTAQRNDECSKTNE